VRLSALRPEHVRGLLKRKLDSGLSPQTVVHTRTVLNTALRQAIGDRLLSWNPVSSVKRPKVRRRPHSEFTSEQARAFLVAAQNTRLGAAFAIGLSLGLRRGEVLGLRWCDIDLEVFTLRVERTIQRYAPKSLAPRASWYRNRRPNYRAERSSYQRCSFRCFGTIAHDKRRKG
jgi:integrase